MRYFAILFMLVVTAACASKAVIVSNADGFSEPAVAWGQYESPNFTLITDVSEARAASFLTELEDFRGFARTTLGAIEGVRPRLVIIAPSSRKGFSVFADPDRIGGRYFRTIDTDFMIVNLSLTRRTNRGLNGNFTAEEILRHEYIHAVIADLPGKPIPTWLNEGLAEYFSTAQRLGDRFLVGRPVDDRLDDLQTFKAQSSRSGSRGVRSASFRVRTIGGDPGLQLAPLETIITANAASQVYRDTRDRTNFHAQAWLIVHRLYSTEEGRAALANYLAERNRAGDEVDVLTRALGEDLRDYDKTLWDQVRAKDFPTQYLPASPKQEVEFISAGPVGEADLWCYAGRFNGLSINTVRAKAVFRHALELDPENVCALSHLSKLESADGNFERAEALTLRAEAVNPEDAFTLLSRAVLYYSQFAKNQADGEAVGEELQLSIDWASRAIVADPTIALSHFIHALMLDQVPNPNALELCAGLHSARATEHLLPQGDPSLKRNTARFLARLGQFNEAREKLEFYQAWTRDEASGELTRQQLAHLDDQIKLRGIFLETGLATPDEYAVSPCEARQLGQQSAQVTVASGLDK